MKLSNCSVRQTRLKALAAIILAGGLVCGSIAAKAQTTYYVDAACGDDGWSGLSPICEEPDGPKLRIDGAWFPAIDGDEIVVAPGVYTDIPGFSSKGLLLRSSDGPETTSIATLNVGGGLQGMVFEGFTVLSQASIGGE